MLSQLVFDENFFKYLIETKHDKDYQRIISRLLLNLQGPVTKFVLSIEEACNYEDIAHWILFLARKGVKDLSIWMNNAELVDLPTHLFSCLELKILDLVGEFFTQCPVLEYLDLVFTDCEGKVKLSEITKLTNLKILNLFLCYLDNTVITSPSSIFELLGFLPKLQELDLDFRNFEFTEDAARKRSPTTFPCLKTIKLSYIDLGNVIMLPFAFEIIRSFPNLQTLEITAEAWYDDPPPAICSLEVDYNSMKLLQLQNVIFKNWKTSENEVCLIDYILACSPFLKKVDIHPHSTLGSDEKMMFAKKLLELHRASPIAEIKLY